MPIIEWPWEQGRVQYRNYDVVRLIAHELVNLHGANIATHPDAPRAPLVNATGLGFGTGPNTFWRNYSRVFKELLLASDPGGILTVTDAATFIDKSNPDAWTFDEYFAFFAPRYYTVSPAKHDYDASAPIVYPVCALLRFLAARGEADVDADVYGRIIGNGCVGSEPLEHYRSLADSGHRAGDNRQVREMLQFFAQASYLKMVGDKISVVPQPLSQRLVDYLLQLAQPIVDTRLSDSASEVLRLGRVDIEGSAVGSVVGSWLGAPLEELPDDAEFAEGAKQRITYLRTERSQKLKDAYAARYGAPSRCDICGLEPLKHFPWIGRSSIHLHHVLPLASSAHEMITSTADIVPLCGICHGAVHAYYRKWFSDNAVNDFRDKSEARSVYEEAKRTYIP